MYVFLKIRNIRTEGLPNRLQNPSGIEDSGLYGPYIASKDAIPYDENRLVPHRLKVRSWLTNEGAPIGPKSENQISNISRENNPKRCISTSV